MDFFAGIESKVLAAIGDKVQYPAYVFVRDEEDSKTGRLAFVDQNNMLKYIRGENKQQVVKVDELPDIAESDVEVLYIMNGIVYVFDGTEYKPMYKDHTTELKVLDERITLLETNSKELEEADKALAEQIKSLEEQFNALEIPEECKCIPNDGYEITDVPEGTLVSYSDKEIRIMCPSNTVFTKQTVGTNGDPNCYYATFKVYVPNDNVVGYIEHLGSQVDETILTDFSTDEYGRKYQPTWLALARYDDATGIWTYYGKNSTKEKYVGWDYRIDWYNAENVLIASDCIRINLSNEDCHFNIEPSYIANATAEVKEKIETLETEKKELTDKVVELEQIVITLENKTPTFVELE
jgi:hypothetical protein